MSTEKLNLPAIAKDLELSVKIDSLNSLLNQTPPKQWLKIHQGVNYQPIERVKNNLITIFQDYDWSIKEVKVIANSITVTGTLSVMNPVTGRIRNVDGVGAWPIQLTKGSKPLEFDNITQGAIQKNAPAAESLAIKSAASKLGKIFSNGDSEVDFAPIYSAFDDSVPEMEADTSLEDTLKAATSLEDLSTIWKGLTPAQKKIPEVLAAKDARKSELS